MFESLSAQDFATPCLMVDAATVHANLHRMQEYANNNKLALRPHTKTHKSIAMASLQIENGCSGLTMAKVGEAEIMAHAAKDLLIAYPAIGAERLRRATEIARHSLLRMAIDSTEAADQISDACKQAGVSIGVLIDIDVGFHRTGLCDLQQISQLAQHINRLEGLRVDGVMCFPGHLLPSSPESEWQNYADSVEAILDKLRSMEISTAIVSGGSTPTAMQSHRNPWLNEIRPGTYIYNDMNEVRLGVATLEDCAARVFATVISRSTHKFVVDAGSKTLSSDRCGPAPDSGFGYVVEFPDAKITRLSEEHGEIQLPDNSPRPNIGDRVTIIPNHICVCVNLQDRFWLVQGDQITSMPVDARGKLI